MTLKERLKQLKAGADRQAVELGHDNAAGAAVAFGRVTGRALGNVVHDAGKVVSAMFEASVEVDRREGTFSQRADKNAPGKACASVKSFSSSGNNDVGSQYFTGLGWDPDND